MWHLINYGLLVFYDQMLMAIASTGIEVARLIHWRFGYQIEVIVKPVPKHVESNLNRELSAAIQQHGLTDWRPTEIE